MSATTETGTLAIPEPEPEISATPVADLDKMVADLASVAGAWRQVDLDARIAMIDRMIDDTMSVAEDWNRSAIVHKGIPRTGGARAEDYFTGPVIVLRNLRLLKESLISLRDTGSTGYGAVRELPGGQIAAKVFPTGLLDNVLFTGFSAEVWMEPGVTADSLSDTVAVAYSETGERPGKVSVVLGAGNVSSIGPMDALYKLFVEDEVVLLKMNPVNAYTGVHVERAFAALVEHGVLKIAYGGGEVGKHLTTHEGVDTLHITGSDKTYEAIVFGGGEEGARRLAADEPVNERPFSSELGNVTPIIVVPGRWSKAEIRYQGFNIASMLANNGGFNCVAARMIVTHERWAQRNELLEAVEHALSTIDERHPYYPGAKDRWQTFMAEHPDAKTFGRDDEEAVPWTLIRDVDETNPDDITFTTEAFCAVFAEVGLNAPTDIGAYLRQAALFCNDALWGNLGASVIIDPATERAHKDDFEQLVAALRYGCVTVNHFAGVPYAMVSPTWGAFPGNPRTDIQSGSGVVHNTYMFDKPQKSVVRGPFKLPMKPVWFANHKTAGDVGPELARIEGKGDATALPALFAKALRG